MKFDKSMKHFYADIGECIHGMGIISSEELYSLIKSADPKPLRDMLKERLRYRGFGYSKMHCEGFNNGIKIRYYNKDINNCGDHELIVSWSSLTVLLRDNEFREKYVFVSNSHKKEEKTMTAAFDLEALIGHGSATVTMLNSDILTDYCIDNRKQPFQVKDDMEMKELTEDIRTNGVLEPIIVRPNGDGTYMILSGHRRRMAAEKNGIKSLPCIIKDCTDIQAKRIMVNANLLTRQKLLPSEKAWAYRVQQEANGVSSTALAKLLELCPREIQRYIRLTYLCDEYLKLIDENKLQMMVGYELSFCSEEKQRQLIEFFSDNGILNKLQKNDVVRFRAAADHNTNLKVLFKDKFEKKISFNQRLKGYFPTGTTPSQIEEKILFILEKHKDELKAI